MSYIEIDDTPLEDFIEYLENHLENLEGKYDNYSSKADKHTEYSASWFKYDNKKLDVSSDADIVRGLLKFLKSGLK